jgi:DNA-binding NarL/FixJ family response regulator
MNDAADILRVVLLEDSAPIRHRLKELVAECACARVVAEAPSVQEALRALEQVSPDVVIADIDLPDGTGMDVLRHVHHHRLPTAVIVLTNYDTPEFRLCCKALGARDFLVKSEEFDRVPEVLEMVQAERG